MSKFIEDFKTKPFVTAFKVICIIVAVGLVIRVAGCTLGLW